MHSRAKLIVGHLLNSAYVLAATAMCSYFTWQAATHTHAKQDHTHFAYHMHPTTGCTPKHRCTYYCTPQPLPSKQGRWEESKASPHLTPASSVCVAGTGGSGCQKCDNGTWSSGDRPEGEPCVRCAKGTSTMPGVNQTSASSCSICAAGWAGRPCAICEQHFYSLGGNALQPYPPTCVRW